jgi:hypothetical protein
MSTDGSDAGFVAATAVAAHPHSSSNDTDWRVTFMLILCLEC